MPELPEVETTLRGIKPYICPQIIVNVIVRHYGLRWPIDRDIHSHLRGNTIKNIARRGKYLILTLRQGWLIIHLGMSGSLRISTESLAIKKHDHVELLFANGYILRLNDPRRFGAFIWTDQPPETHSLLNNLGPEPLDDFFTPHYLLSCAQNKKIAIKNFIMDSKVVVGVGNIYANEALFLAKIHPSLPTKFLELADCVRLCAAIKKILRAAIEQGGTTVRDFLQSNGKPGYFAQKLAVYGRKGLPCVGCKTSLTVTRLGQRATFFCGKCQKYPPQKNQP